MPVHPDDPRRTTVTPSRRLPARIAPIPPRRKPDAGAVPAELPSRPKPLAPAEADADAV